MFIYMEIYNMILSGIIRVNGSGIDQVSLNPIPLLDFSLFKPIPGPYPSGIRYTLPICFGFRVYLSGLGFFAIPIYISCRSLCCVHVHETTK
ncbi:hypothetical protein Hanom_Chr13g01215261 [Helianthus anomalus]